MSTFSYDHENPVRYDDSIKKDDKKKAKKKKTKDLKGVSTGLLGPYLNMETKSNVNNSLIKSLVDTLAAGLIGPALSAALGKFSPLAGIALSFGGHYTGEQSGLMRGIGMSTIAHGVAKAKDYRDADSTLTNRLSELKDDWLSMILMGNTAEKKSIFNGIEGKVEIEPFVEPTEQNTESNKVTSISQELADFEENTTAFLEQQAMEYETERIEDEQFQNDEERHQSETNPFQWGVNNWEESMPLTIQSQSSEIDIPEDFDFSEF